MFVTLASCFISSIQTYWLFGLKGPDDIAVGGFQNVDSGAWYVGTTLSMTALSIMTLSVMVLDTVLLC